MTGEIKTLPKIDEPKGVGGWLLLFCFGLTIFSPLRTCAGLMQEWDRLKPGSVFPVVRQAAIVGTAVSMFVVLYGVVVGWMIWRGSPRGKALARQYLLVRAAIVLVTAALTVLWAHSGFGALGAKRAATAMASITAQDILYCSIWWLYFTFSKRVQNTYGERAEK